MCGYELRESMRVEVTLVRHEREISPDVTEAMQLLAESIAVGAINPAQAVGAYWGMSGRSTNVWIEWTFPDGTEVGALIAPDEEGGPVLRMGGLGLALTSSGRHRRMAGTGGTLRWLAVVREPSYGPRQLMEWMASTVPGPSYVDARAARDPRQEIPSRPAHTAATSRASRGLFGEHDARGTGHDD